MNKTSILIDNQNNKDIKISSLQNITIWLQVKINKQVIKHTIANLKQAFPQCFAFVFTLSKIDISEKSEELNLHEIFTEHFINQIFAFDKYFLLFL